MPFAVAAIVGAKNQHKKKHKSAASFHQLQYYLDQRLLGSNGQPLYSPRVEKVVGFAIRIELSSWFNNLIVFVICWAGVLAGLSTYSAMEKGTAGEVISVMDTIILSIFTVEIVVKLLASGRFPQRYFKDAWNCFDFSIVVLSYVGQNASGLSFDFAVLRVIRLLRVLKLVNALEKLRVLVTSLLSSFKAISYVCMLLTLLFYVYSVMACFLFKDNDPFHFRNLHHSVLTLYRASTFEDWTDIMYINIFGCRKYGYSSAPTRLDGSPAPWWMHCEHSQASSVLSALFFCSFSLLATMILFNLFIGVILTNIDKAQAELAQEKMRQKAQIRHSINFLKNQVENRDQPGHKWKKLAHYVNTGLWRQHFGVEPRLSPKPASRQEASSDLSVQLFELDNLSANTLQLLNEMENLEKARNGWGDWDWLSAPKQQQQPMSGSPVPSPAHWPVTNEDSDRAVGSLATRQTRAEFTPTQGNNTDSNPLNPQTPPPIDPEDVSVS